MRVAPSASEVEVEGKRLRLTNLEKVLYPEVSFTKGAIIDYYMRIAPVMLPHLAGRPLTRKRYPNGVDQDFFYEKQCPKHKPEWMRTITIGHTKRDVDFCVVDNVPGLVWLANLASIELHPLLAREPHIDRPTKITFDLDPGAPATITECCVVALELRSMLGDLDLECFPKTSGSKGMQIDVPLDGKSTYDQTKPFAHAIAQVMEKKFPKLVVSRMEKAVRNGKIFIDWSQNDDSKTTVCVYSLRAKPTPTVSTPITWDEVEAGANGEPLSFISDEVLARVEELGDLHADVETLKQKLPELNV